MSDWRSLLQRGVERGLLPDGALDTRADHSERHWPLIVLSFAGAVLAALPLVAFVLELFGPALERDLGPYLVAPLLIAATCLVLRGGQRSLFVENLALVLLLTGLGLLFFGILRDLSTAAYFVCALLALVTAIAVPVNWLRSLLGAVAAAFCLGTAFDWHDRSQAWYLLLAVAALWLLAIYLQDRLLVGGGHAPLAIALEWTLAGWLVQLLFAFVVLAGMTFMVAGVVAGSGVAGELTSGLNRGDACQWTAAPPVQSLIAVLLVVGAAFWGGRRWPALHSPIAIGLAVVLAVLSCFSPSLGPLTLIGVVALVTRRPLRAAAAAFAAAWVVGSFYYSLCWDLLSKGLVLIVAGLALGVLAFLGSRRGESESPARLAGGPRSKAATFAVALGVLSTLAVVNVSVWQKEAIIAAGRPIFIALAPVDPRSLLQGDYMALNYVLSAPLQAALAKQDYGTHALAVARVDASGVAQLLRLADAIPLADDEIRVELVRQAGRWVVASNAWFFSEGDGERWSAARYGEFRVLADGQALLVGLADERLARLAR